ncbi:hypothetical protein HDU76_003259, partial [Blyttiomyces sp. JEL0837]
EKGPYIYVGHSFGGYTVRQFLKKYPEQVAGIAFLDASHEDFIDWMDLLNPRDNPSSKLYKTLNDTARFLSIINTIAPFGIDRLAYENIKTGFDGDYEKGVENGDLFDEGQFPWLRDRYEDVDRAMVFNGRFYKAVSSELYSFGYTSAEQARAARPPRPFKDLPIAVVTSGVSIHGACPLTNLLPASATSSIKQSYPYKALPPIVNPPDCASANETVAFATAWLACQRDLASSFSEDTVWTVAEGATHFVMIDRPEVVVEAVLGVVERVVKRRKGEK